MKSFLLLGSLILFFYQSVALPVKHLLKEEPPEDNSKKENFLEFLRYMREVQETLESDPEFREKLANANIADISSARISHELEYVHHNLRSKLDEIKRRELERLRHLATKRFEMENDLDGEHLKIMKHLDHENPHTFEIPDLKKVIAQFTVDLRKFDKKRRDEFKEYKMQKKFEQEQELNDSGLTEEARKEYKEKSHKMGEKRKNHESLHHPGSKQQLTEVWEKDDHMDGQDFDPKTFFYLHDLDGNGFWDQTEVKVLFLKELDKAYVKGKPEDDHTERYEEMERMREHVFEEQDLNRDWLISLQEFVQQTESPNFSKDEGWATIDEQEIFSNKEYEEFKKYKKE